MPQYLFQILSLCSCIALLACDSTIGAGVTPPNAVLTNCPPEGDSNYCRDCGPCADGVGDCDDDSECASGLTCVTDVGDQYGYGPSVDVCVLTCPPEGDSNYCRDCGPCADGVGDCDDDSECASGLTCVTDVGDQYGYGPSVDVCVLTCPPEGDSNYCRDCGPCADGVGDCDDDSECASGLTCVTDVGDQYGYGPSVDVCVLTCPPEGDSNDCRDCATMFVDKHAIGCSSGLNENYDSDSRSCGSSGIHRMFRNIQAAADAARAGDRVHVREGRYRAVWFKDVKGTSEAPIVFMSHPGERATIDKYLGGGDGYRAITVRTGGYLVLDGFEITNSDPKIAGEKLFTYDPNDPDDLEELKKHVSMDAIKSNPPKDMPKPHHVTFQNNEIHHHWRTGILWFGDDSRFINNSIHHVSFGTYINGKRQTIANNQAYANIAVGIRAGNDQTWLSDSVIENNIFHSNGNGPAYYHGSSDEPIKFGEGMILFRGANNIIRNNIAYNNGRFGFWIAGYTPTHNLIANNVAYDNARTGFLINAKIANVVRNNIAYANRLEVDIGASNIVDHNLFDEDPLFSDPTNGDFSLLSGSPAIDTGADIAEVATDISGAIRPHGEATDKGAYEYGAPPTAPIVRCLSSSAH